MLSERRWSDGSTALKFLKSKANNMSSSSNSNSPPPVTNNGNPFAPPSPVKTSPKFYRRAISAPVSVPVVTVISDDFCSPINSTTASEASFSNSGTYDDDTTASLSATDDSVPDFPAGELAMGSSGTENFIRKFWKRRKSLTINEYDPSFKVVYLGNVLTGWAKGQFGIFEKS